MRGGWQGGDPLHPRRLLLHSPTHAPPSYQTQHGERFLLLASFSFHPLTPNTHSPIGRTARSFHMERMEECMGGQLPGYAFNLDTYSARMREVDAETEEELRRACGKVRAQQGTRVPRCTGT